MHGMTYLRQSTDHLTVTHRVGMAYNHNNQFIKIATSLFFIMMPSLSLLFIIALVERLNLKHVRGREEGFRHTQNPNSL